MKHGGGYTFMSATVDSRIVEMRFDNSHFEKNAQQTIGSMNTLKQSLDVGNTAIAFNSLGDSFFDAYQESDRPIIHI